MLAEGTLKTSTPVVNGSGVVRQAASLPSSSKQATVTKSVVSEEEGKNAAASRPVDTITLSDAVSVDNIKVSTGAQGAATPNGQPATSQSDDSDQAQELTSGGVRDAQFAEEARRAEEAAEEEDANARLEEISEEAQAKLLNQNISLKFRTDEETGEDLFQFVDKGSGDVVRQIPAEEALEFLKKFETISGLLFSEQA
jgi:flagellar protein FlaG